MISSRSLDLMNSLPENGTAKAPFPQCRGTSYRYLCVFGPIQTYQCNTGTHFSGECNHPNGWLKLDALKHLRIHEVLELVEIEEGAAAIGANPTILALRRRTGVVQIAVVRKGKPIYQRDPAFSYEVGDTVVLVGDSDGLARAMALFRSKSALPDAPDTSVVLDSGGDGQVHTDAQ